MKEIKIYPFRRPVSSIAQWTRCEMVSKCDVLFFSLSLSAVIRPSDVIDPTLPKRKITILGDTHSAKNIAPLALESDLVIHEVIQTIFYFFFILIPIQCTLQPHLERESKLRGHSTARNAVNFAASVGARSLLLNHICDHDILPVCALSLCRYCYDASLLQDLFSFLHSAQRQAQVHQLPVIMGCDNLCVDIAHSPRYSRHPSNEYEKNVYF